MTGGPWVAEEPAVSHLQRPDRRPQPFVSHKGVNRLNARWKHRPDTDRETAAPHATILSELRAREHASVRDLIARLPGAAGPECDPIVTQLVEAARRVAAAWSELCDKASVSTAGARTLRPASRAPGVAGRQPGTLHERRRSGPRSLRPRPFPGAPGRPADRRLAQLQSQGDLQVPPAQSQAARCEDGADGVLLARGGTGSGPQQPQRGDAPAAAGPGTRWIPVRPVHRRALPS